MTSMCSALLLALLLLSTAASPAVAQVQLSRLDGVVVDAADRPVGGVTVTVSDPLGATIRRVDGRRERALPDRRSPAGPLPSGRGWRRRGDVTGAADDRRWPLVQRDAAHAARVPRRRGRRRRPPRGVDRDAHVARRRIDRPDARPRRIAAAAGRRRHAARLGHRGQRPAAQPRRRRRLPLRRRRRARLRAARSDVGPGAGRVDDRRAHRRDRLRAAGVRLQVRRRHRRAHARGDRARGAGSAEIASGERRRRRRRADRPAVPSGVARRCGCRRAASDRRASSIRSIPTTSTTTAAA